IDAQYDRLHAAAIELNNVGTALESARETFTAAQRALRQALDDAESGGFAVGDDGSVSWPPGHPDDQAAFREQAEQIAERIRRALAEATRQDESVASALRRLASAVHGIGLTDGEQEQRLAADARLVAELAGGVDASRIPPPGTDPQRVADWWKGLSEAEREQYLHAYPDRVGMLDGLPAVARDEANRSLLEQRLAELRGRRDRLSGEEEKILRGLEQIETQLERSALDPKALPLYVLGLDTRGDGRAIVAVGNPDTAKHTAVVVPGLGTELNDIGGQIGRARRLARAADDMTPERGDVAAIAWLGYDAPELHNVAGGGRAETGAPELDRFVDGIRAVHGSEHRHVTVVGHSYGSTVVGEAAKRPGGLAADDLIVAGSPGMRVDNIDQLQIERRHVWAGSAEGDRVSGFLGNFSHGPEPHEKDFGANRYVVDTEGHSDYWKDNSESLRNQARIVVGKYQEVSLEHGERPEDWSPSG
ncbi:hypothetical protein TR74_13775, partial [Carbonactinospora thermoautotrophica]